MHLSLSRRQRSRRAVWSRHGLAGPAALPELTSLGIFLISLAKEDRMKVTSLTSNLTQLTRVRFVNAFLVHEDDGITLVDTTIGRGADGFIEAARQAGGPIRRIALTH